MGKAISLYICILLLVAGQMAQATPRGALSPRQTARIDSLMQAGLKAGYYPGASIAVGNSRELLLDACCGWQDCEKTVPVCAEDVYDLASLTKIVSTTLAVMKLYDRGLIRLDATVGTLLPQFARTPIAGITVRELLTHTSGLGNIMLYRLLFSNPEGESLTSAVCSDAYPCAVDKDTYLCRTPRADAAYLSDCHRDGYRRAGESCYVNPAVDTLIASRIVRSYKPSGRGQYLYSDLNFHLLMQIVERIAGRPLNEFVAEIYALMGMRNTGYRPLEWKPAARIVPTEDDRLMQRGLLRGYTHDEIAAVSGNVGGNAGLFSNTADLALYCRMMLGGGTLDGRQIISASTVKRFTTAMPRALGFDRRTGNTPLAHGYGHTGYTGTILWIDPASDLFMVFLSNRVHPSRTNQGLVTSGLRTKLWNAVIAQ